MCFSAAGSFTISALLTGIGAVSMGRGGVKPGRMFAAIPLIFAAQQAAEGLVWLTIDDARHAVLHRVAVNAFLGVAFVVWPTWLPCSLLLLERNSERRRSLTLLFWFGSLAAMYASLLLLVWPPSARVAGHCLAYDHPMIHDEARLLLHLCGYVVASVVPFFVSTAALARTLGGTLIVSLAAAFLVQRDALTSVWCFFAAVLSILVLVAVGRQQQPGMPLGEAVARTS